MEFFTEFQTRADFESRLALIERRLEQIEEEVLRRSLGLPACPAARNEDAVPSRGGDR